MPEPWLYQSLSARLWADRGSACGHTGRLRGMVCPCNGTVQDHDGCHPWSAVTQAAPTVFRPPCAPMQRNRTCVLFMYKYVKIHWKSFMAAVKYFYVSVILCPFAVEGEYKTGHTQNICGILSVGGFTAHTLAGSDVRQVGQSSFAGKRQLL